MLLKVERQQLILGKLKNDRQVTVTELSRLFDVSEITIRRDLQELEAEGVLQRAHGGAVLATPAPPEPPIIQRLNQTQAWKAQIGRAAAALIHDGESIFLSSGSTVTYVARNLLARQNLTVVTNALNIAIELAAAEEVNVVVAGGMLRAAELSVIGHITALALREVRVDKVIMGMQAIDLEAGMSHDYLPEVTTGRMIMEMAPELIVVADHTKFGKRAAAYIAPVERITTLVTDVQTDAAILSQLKQRGVRVIVVDEET
jgi:DeoR/GlpR family transcriptional regulator of sugar metabolism